MRTTSVLAIATCMWVAACSETSNSNNNNRTTTTGTPASFSSCGSFATQAEAQAFYNQHKVAHLDSDGDGVACEHLAEDGFDTESLAVAKIPNDSPTAGHWVGASDAGEAIAGAILADGELWFRHPGGRIVHGASRAQGGSVSASDAIVLDPARGTLEMAHWSASYREQQTLSGTLSYPRTSDSVSFAARYETAYARVPHPADLAGAYTGSAGAVFATLSISPTGELGGVDARGCSFSGSATPRPRGNVFDVTLSFGGGRCAHGSASVAGIVLPGADSRSITVLALDAARARGFEFSGRRP